MLSVWLCVLCCDYMRSVMSVYIFFFFKQKTAYEMRISDWSSDVCSSDLEGVGGGTGEERLRLLGAERPARPGGREDPAGAEAGQGERVAGHSQQIGRARVGKECVSTWRSRWSPDH